MAATQKDPYDEGRTRREEVAYARLVSELAVLQWRWDRDRLKPGMLPPGGAAATPPPGPRRKLTLKLDADVAKWFRAMGHGYQARMNYALRCWMVSVVERELAADAELWR